MLITTSVAQTLCTEAEELDATTISFPSLNTTIDTVFVDSTASTYAFAKADVYDVANTVLGCVPDLTYEI